MLVDLILMGAEVFLAEDVFSYRSGNGHGDGGGRPTKTKRILCWNQRNKNDTKTNN